MNVFFMVHNKYLYVLYMYTYLVNRVLINFNISPYRLEVGNNRQILIIEVNTFTENL